MASSKSKKAWRRRKRKRRQKQFESLRKKVEQGPFRMPRYIIRKIRLAHCKRGPSICEKCREMDAEKICLLDICPSRVGEIQRRVIEVNREGEKSWHEFDIVRMFESQEEAQEYADENGIDDVEF